MDMLTIIAENLPIIVLFVLGIGLLIAEAVMPGFGAPGFTGIALEAVALTWTWFRHGPLVTLAMLLVVLLVLAIAISTSLRSIKSGRLSRSALVLSSQETAEQGYSAAEELGVFLNKTGTATTVLRPTGIADFEGVRLNVSSEGDYVPAGMKVKIVKVEGSRILVRPL